MRKTKEIDILIVDDEKDLCYLLKNMLSKRIPSEIDVCHSVEDAHHLLKKKKYDIAYFDYQLSDGTGFELVEFIQKEIPKAPFIITMSANINSNEIENWLQKGAKTFISKPLSKEKINNSLDLYFAK